MKTIAAPPSMRARVHKTLPGQIQGNEITKGYGALSQINVVNLPDLGRI